MRFDSSDLRAMPEDMQVQAAVKLAAELAKTTKVAGGKEKKSRKVTAKRICLRGARAATRYEVLRDAVRQGVISELDLVVNDGYIVAFTYQIVWCGEFIPTGLPVSTLVVWRQIGKNQKVIEPIIREVCG